MPCPVVGFELLDVRGPCVDGRMEARFRVTVHEVSAGPLVVADIMTGDFSFGPAEIQISVYFPDDEDLAAWQAGGAPDSRTRIYTHRYLPGSYPNVRLRFAPIPGLSNCPDIDLSGGELGRVEVPPCPDDPAPPCPEISWTEPSVAESCDAAGLWPVGFTAIVASTAVGGELFWVDADDVAHPVENQSATVVGDTRVLSGTRAFPPGPVRLRAATSCGAAGLVLELPACPGPPCPKVVISQPLFGTACVDGRRTVFVNASVALPPGATGFLHARLVDGEGVVLDDRFATGNALQLSGQGAYPGGLHAFAVQLLAPAGCGASEDRIEIAVPACPPPPVTTTDPDCPDIVIEQLTAEVEAGCTGNCPVAVVLRVALPDGLDETATIALSDDAGQIDSTTATAGVVERSLSRVYAAGEHFVRAVVSLPSGCSYQAEQPFTVAAADGGQTPGWWPDWLPVSCTWCCIGWMLFNIVLLVATAVMIGVTACFFQWYLLIITVALAIFTFLSVVLNMLACAWQPDACIWARWLPRIIALIGLVAGVIVLVVAIIEAIVFWETGAIASLPCFLGAVIEFGYFGFLAFVTWEILYFLGCNPMSFDDIAALAGRLTRRRPG